MKEKRAQSLIVVLWILVVLTLLALSLGHRVSMSLRLSKYQRDKLKAYCLAQTELNKTILQIKKLGRYELDKDKIDGLDISIIEEEVKININNNSASMELLVDILEHLQISSAQEKAENILIWTGKIPDNGNKYRNYFGYPAKGKEFSNNEELMPAADITSEDYDKLKEFITVYGNVNKLSVNINTAPMEIIRILAENAAQSGEENSINSVVSKIEELRKKGPILTKEDIKIETTVSEENNLFSRLKDNLITESNFFTINAQGNVNKITSKIIVVYDRLNSRIIYWHES